MGRGAFLQRGGRPGCSAAVVLLLLLAPLSSALRRLQQSAAVRRAIAQPDYALYHRQQELLDQVASIVAANPDIMHLEKRSAKDGLYAVDMQIVTVELSGLSNRHHEKARLLLDFGEHGREYVSSELGLLLLQTLTNRTALETVLGGNTIRGRRLIRLLEASVIKILPMENEQGRKLVEGGKLCERKNGRGVDPNRNWPVDWGKKEKDYDPQEEYPGKAPFSEPEVQMLRALATHFRPHVWLNVHSGMEAMFTPYDHKAEVPGGAQAALSLLRQIQQEVMGGTGCVIGSGGKTVGYLAHGTATDYMYEVLKVPLPFTWEIYGDFNADFHDCFRMFNPLTGSALQVVLERWLRALMMLVELLPTHPAMAGVSALQLAAGEQEGSAHGVLPDGGQGLGLGLGDDAGNSAASTPAHTQGHVGTSLHRPTTVRTSVPTSTSTTPSSTENKQRQQAASAGGLGQQEVPGQPAAAAATPTDVSGGPGVVPGATWQSSLVDLPGLQRYWRERQLQLWIALGGLVLLCALLIRAGYMSRSKPAKPGASDACTSRMNNRNRSDSGSSINKLCHVV